MSSFEIVPLREEIAERVRSMRRDDWGNTELVSVRADAKPGYPCRVCLRDAEPGEELLLFSYSPFDAPTPQRTVGPIYIHARRSEPWRTREVPAALRHRLLSLRTFDARGQMLAARVAQGAELEAEVERLFADPAAAAMHVHNAKPGCFACVIRRSAS